MAFDRKAWVQQNRDRLRTYHSEWRKRNKDRIRRYTQAEKAKENRRAYDSRPENRRKAIERVNEWIGNNRQRHNERTSRWKKNNPESRSLNSSTRRARQLNAPGSHTTEETRVLLRGQNHRCANPYCKADLRKVRRCLDHVVPLSKGGSNSIENLQWLCRPCNESKGAKDYDEWLSYFAATRAKMGPVKQGARRCASISS